MIWACGPYISIHIVATYAPAFIVSVLGPIGRRHALRGIGSLSQMSERTIRFQVSFLLVRNFLRVRYLRNFVSRPGVRAGRPGSLPHPYHQGNCLSFAL